MILRSLTSLRKCTSERERERERERQRERVRESSRKMFLGLFCSEQFGNNFTRELVGNAISSNQSTQRNPLNAPNQLFHALKSSMRGKCYFFSHESFWLQKLQKLSTAARLQCHEHSCSAVETRRIHRRFSICSN